mmetsp:Transcript_19807/g.27243  ORF Transcript_19807/g.27243 Transcript_19807/m.27243 type:complete len:81 (+) Transcript_19807:448-690(+)
MKALVEALVGLEVNVTLEMDRAVGLEVDATFEMGILVGGIVGTGDPAQAPGKQADHQAFANVQQELTGQHALPAKLAPPH